MSFKDLYKSANNNISGDRKLIDVIYEKAEEKPIFNFKYATLCAASLILAISLGVFPILNKQTEKPNVQIAKKPPESIVKVKEETNEKKEKQTVDTNTTYVPEEIPNENKSTNVSDNYQLETESNDVNVTLPETDASVPGLNDVQIAYDSMPKNEIISSGGAGTLAIAKSTSQDDNLANDQMTLQKYFEYLGIENLDFKSSLPYGMSFDMPEHVSVLLSSTTNAIEDDLIQFVAVDSKDPQKILTLSTSTKSQEDFLYDVITDINGISIKKHTDENSISLYFEYSRACITVQSYGITEEDLDMFLNSFLK